MIDYPTAVDPSRAVNRGLHVRGSVGATRREQFRGKAQGLPLQ
jgi:hypothetical protein